MGKNKNSRFVQQQNYNRHLQNKAHSNVTRRINKSNRVIDEERQKMNDSIKETFDEFIKDNGLDPDKIPNNSRIIIFELLRKNIEGKLDTYIKYVEEHPEDEKLQEYIDAQEVCKNVLEQIRWIYDWSLPLEDRKYNLDENYETLLDAAQEKLDATEKKFDKLSDILTVFDETTLPVNKEALYYFFYRFCKFIVKNNVDQYYTYISNTIKNLLILNSSDPVVEFLIKNFVTVDNNSDCEN